MWQISTDTYYLNVHTIKIYFIDFSKTEWQRRERETDLLSAGSLQMAPMTRCSPDRSLEPGALQASQRGCGPRTQSSSASFPGVSEGSLLKEALRPHLHASVGSWDHGLQFNLLYHMSASSVHIWSVHKVKTGNILPGRNLGLDYIEQALIFMFIN